MWIAIRILRRENELLFGIISELTNNIRFRVYFNKPGQEYENLIFFLSD